MCGVGVGCSELQQQFDGAGGGLVVAGFGELHEAEKGEVVKGLVGSQDMLQCCGVGVI